MTHIHYKFSSKLSYDTLIFDGPHVTVRELKKRIMSKEKLRSGVCELQISNAQTKEEYVEEDLLISKGTSVIVKRIPVIKVNSSTNSKTRNFELSDIPCQSSGFGGINSMTNLASAELSEEDKLKVLMNQSPYNISSYNMKHGAGLPASYTCFRCGNPGHHIRNCPIDKSSDAPLRLKKSTGIPRSFMVQVDDPNIQGAMLTNSGHYAVPAIHAKAYAIGKKERPPFLPQEQPVVEEEDPIPTELLCLICQELLTDAVVIPCCGNSYCDECIRNALLESDEHVCPTCQESNVSPDNLIANIFLRQAVNTFQKERGQPKIKRRCDTPQSNNPDKQPASVSTQPPVTMQRQPQKPHQAANCQQTVEAKSSSEACVAPPIATDPAPASSVQNTSLQLVQKDEQISNKDPAEKICDDSADAGLSALVANKDATTTASQVSDTAAEEQPKMFSLTAHQSSNPAQGQHWPSTHRETSVTSSSSSSSSFPKGGWSNSNPSYSTPSYPAVPPPLIPSPYFHTYPPGYPPATPMWNQVPQGAPIPSLCSSTKEWSGHQRRNERSPHRGPTHRCSPSPSKSSKSSQSYSSSRSRSRSRSLSKSRRQSQDSRHRRSDTRSHSSYSYSYGYKRSPTPSSSSSSRVSYRSRSRSPSDHHKSYRSRHHSKKSGSGRHSSTRCSEERYRYAQQWKREYNDWCDKYFNSNVSHFHQLPPTHHNLPPSLLPQWRHREGTTNYSYIDKASDGQHHHRGHTTELGSHSPLSQPSSNGECTSSESANDSRSSPSDSPNKSQSRKGTARIDTDWHRNPAGSKASVTRSEKTRKRREEDVERSVEIQSSTDLKTNISVVPETCKSESQTPEKSKVKMERKTSPMLARDVWEGEIKIKPQKRISININLDGKKKEEKNGQTELLALGSTTGKTMEDDEEKFHQERTTVNVMESSRDQEDECHEKVKPDGLLWMEDTPCDHMGQMRKKTAGEKKEEDLQLCALRGNEEGSKKLQEEQDRIKASNNQKRTNSERKSMKRGDKEERMRNEGGSKEMRKLIPGTQKETTEGESTCVETGGNSLVESKEELMEETKLMNKYLTRHESHQDGPERPDSGSPKDGQGRKMVARTLEQYTHGRALGEDELFPIQVPRPKWEKHESEGKEHHEGEIQDQRSVPSSSSSLPVKEGKEEKYQQREKKRETMSRSHGGTAPSSGKYGPDSTSPMRDWVRADVERSRDWQKARSKEKRREEERERERARRKRTSLSSLHSDRPRGTDKGPKSSSVIRWNTELPAHKICRGTFPDMKIQDKEHSQFYHDVPSLKYKDNATGTQHSPASLHHSPSQDRGPLSSECMQNRSRYEKRVEKEERKHESIRDDKKAGKRLRDKGYELEEGERLSSDDSENEWRKKEKKQQQRKRKAASELEEREPNKHKKSKNIFYH